MGRATGFTGVAVANVENLSEELLFAVRGTSGVPLLIPSDV
jgi:hypothetical protein